MRVLCFMQEFYTPPAPLPNPRKLRKRGALPAMAGPFGLDLWFCAWCGVCDTPLNPLSLTRCGHARGDLFFAVDCCAVGVEFYILPNESGTGPGPSPKRS